MYRDSDAHDDTGGRDQGGYLLIEVLITMVFVMIAILAIMPLYTMAMSQNALAKDMTIGSSLAMERIEEFADLRVDDIRRGTCCNLTNPPVAVANGACGIDEVKVDGITYERTCVIRWKVDNATFSDDNDAATYDFTYGGIAHIEVTVTPSRSSHLGNRQVKPAVVSYWRIAGRS